MIIQLYKQFYVSILVQDGAIQMHYGSYKILKLYKKDESSSSVFINVAGQWNTLLAL